MMKESYKYISDQPNAQLQQGVTLRNHLDRLKDVMRDTSRAAEDLHSLLNEDDA